MIYLQLHLHERKVLPIGNMLVAYYHVNYKDNIPLGLTDRNAVSSLQAMQSIG